MKDNKIEKLRKKAEEILKLEGLDKSAEYFNDFERLIEELNIFQIELEMQNRELEFSNRKIIVEQEKYHDLYQNAPIAYLTINETGNIFEINNAAAAMLGASAHSFNKTSIFPYLEENSKKNFNQFFKNVFKSSKVEQTEINFIDRNDKIIYTKINAQSYFDYNLKKRLCRCAITDFTKQKKNEILITAQNELLQLAFDNERVAWWDWDYTSGEVRFSPNKATMLGYSVAEFPTNVYKITELIHPSDYALTMKIMLEHLQGKTSQYEVTYRIKTKAGNYVYYYDYGKVIERTEDGKPKRLNGIVFNINEQKQVEVALQQAKTKAENNENYNKMLFEILPIGLALAKSSGELVYVNKAFTDIIGYSVDETLKLSYWDITPETYLPHEKVQIENLETTGFYGPYIKEYKHKNGKLIPVRLIGRYVYIEGEKYIWSSIENYSDKKEYEQKILKSEQRFRGIYEQSAAGISIINSKQQFIEANNKFCEILGYSKEEFLTLKVQDITYPEDAEKNFDNVKKIIANNNSGFNIEKRYVRKNGDVIWANLSVNVVNDSNGQTEFAIATIVDITDKKNAHFNIIKAKERTEESEKKLQLALSVAKIGYWRYEIATDKVEWSNGHHFLFGIPLESFKQNLDAVQECVHPDDREYGERNLLKTIIEDVPFDNTYRVIFPNGEIRWLHSFGYLYKSLQNKPEYVFGITHDITERLQNERALILAKEKAEESNKLKTAFLNNISHEIRTPLNAIMGFSQLFANHNTTNIKFKKFSKIIESNSNKLIDIITDVIEVAQLQSNQISIKNGNFNFIELINEINTEYKTSITGKGLEFKFNFSPNFKTFFINSDKTKIYKIFKHLIDNAIKFTAKGNISVNCNFAENTIELSVADTGIGISPEMQEIIFEPFRQVETDISKNVGGTGIGLALVKGFVKSLKGEINLKSEPNVGTTFLISIPFEKSQTSNNELITENILPKILDTILIVDDEISNYDYLAEIVQEHCRNMLHAFDGEQAIDFCRNNQQIDLILMDIKMPGIDGNTATKLIKAFRPNLPIIAQTAYANDNDKEQFLESGFDDFICKPFSIKTLCSLIDKYSKS